MNRNNSKTKIDWLKAEQEYLSDNQASLSDIAKRVGISHSRLKKVSMEKGWHEKKKKLIEKGKQQIELEAEETITEQIKQHRRDATYIKNTVLTEIKSRVENGQLRNENLSILTRLLDIGLRELRESFPKNLVISENQPEPIHESVSPDLEEAISDVLAYKVGRKRPSIHFDEGRRKRWENNIDEYLNHKKTKEPNLENNQNSC